MKRIRNLFLIATAIISLSILTADAQGLAAGKARASRPIEQQIFKKILGLPDYGVFDHIVFQLDGGTVLLTGKVLSLGTRKAAENAVRRVPGVQQVVNNIQNLPPSGFDDSIRYRLLREFAGAPGVYGYLREPNPSVRIIVENGHVTLEGFVNNRGTASYMSALANGIPGVFSVRNNLIVQSEVDR